MKNTSLLFGSVVLATLPQLSNAATYTWNGSANDGDWSTASNWDGGTAPTTLSASSVDTIIFDGANMPTSSIPTYVSGTSENSALMFFNGGGAFALDVSSSFGSSFVSQVNATILTVGDGIGGGTEDVIVNVSGMTNLLRHASATANFLVNADGVLNFSSGLNLYNDNNKDATLTLAGGSITAAGTLDTQFNTQAGSYIDFTVVGSSFTANYGAGSAFTNFAAVQADASSVFKNNAGGTLQFTDNGSSSFTVTAVPEPGTYALLAGLTGLAFVSLRRRRA